jgi:hypothetical protein
MCVGVLLRLDEIGSGYQPLGVSKRVAWHGDFPRASPKSISQILALLDPPRPASLPFFFLGVQ